MKKLIIINALVVFVAFCIFTSCCEECQIEFSKTMEDKMVAIDAKIKELETNAADLGEEAKVEFAKAIEDLKTLKEAAQAKLKALKSAGEDAWQDMKPALSDAMTELEKGFDKAKSHF